MPLLDEAVRRQMMPIYDALGYLTRRLEQRIFQEHEATAAALKLTRAQLAIFSTAILIPDLEQAELAQIVGYDKATTGVVLGALEKRGLITRCRSGRSRRGWLVKATPIGKLMGKQQLAMLGDLQGNILAPLEEDERLTFLRLLSKVLEVRNSYYID
ncbi:hypothetical protein ASE85_10915 [Sphingobium sp. Leaf26]|uniref:MarR family winged helix-turn-helix transcriptional regulator n=1 Tax=Sphingobium sp. Leaf26 TaxID=1735693 RepID=UPI0007159099|nr:MarR family winged helix-turn-helix transcriptional regulator [Sphingobium sp. Leaf26]KQM99221.1 hypothetical protein ASE85_10915 [Sphingobium sp. Leaf26]